MNIYPNCPNVIETFVVKDWICIRSHSKSNIMFRIKLMYLIQNIIGSNSSGDLQAKWGINRILKRERACFYYHTSMCMETNVSLDMPMAVFYNYHLYVQN